MQRLFKIVCRGSKLSLAQADIVKKRMMLFDPAITLEVVIKETQGDVNQSIPLQELEGKDFFTKDIQDFLLTGQADFAVHSLKDVSGNFFNENHFAIIERDDPRDVAIFNDDVLNCVSQGQKLKIGTSSPRRATMATDFLRKALPQVGKLEIIIEASVIRGNVDTRLQKLTSGGYNGIILACAGLNRLLQTNHKKSIEDLLKSKVIMILPLLHCPPAPGQGTIVVETRPENAAATQILQAINDKPLANAAAMERKVAHRYGSGCHQQFGVVHINMSDSSFIYAAGKDREGKAFAETYSQEGIATTQRKNPVQVDSNCFPFAQQNIQLMIHPSESVNANKRLWVSETDLWFDLAKKGFWIEGSLEGLGLKFNEYTIKSRLVEVCAFNEQRGLSRN